ncbi:MAG: acylhydrolase [Flavobacteriales bacterium]|nr:MAG: acylhydrolase [Flavobacteriales bacterium]
MFFKTNAQDWPNLNRYKKTNITVVNNKEPVKAVFMGNSITEGWMKYDSAFFKDNHYVNRGISGQTSPQMLLRFTQDVLDLQPKVVVILAGTNDIAENTGPITDKEILDNIKAMAALAKANNIKIILCSILPASYFPWRKGLHPDKRIPRVNTLIQNYAKDNHLGYVDYFSAMANKKNGLIEEYGNDAVHPNEKGYQIMAPLVKSAIEKILK